MRNYIYQCKFQQLLQRYKAISHFYNGTNYKQNHSDYLQQALCKKIPQGAKAANKLPAKQCNR